MKSIIIIGGGASGMMAAYAAAKNGHKVVLLEKNEKLGKKIYITGKGRCNFTNACEIEELFEQIIHNKKFMYSAFYQFSNMQTMELFESLGLAYKVERGNRVFPLSDKANDVTKTLEKELKRLGVVIQLQTKVVDILVSDSTVRGVVLEHGKQLLADAVMIATGGCSYPSTGSTGDGYVLAKKLGHTITKLRPGLVPLETKESYIPMMQGLSLKNVTLVIKDGKKIRYEEFGEMLFTHFGISGPLGLRASSVIGEIIEQHPLDAYVDLKPAITEEQLEKRLLREFDDNKNCQINTICKKLVPAKMVPVMLDLLGVQSNLDVNCITKEIRQRFVYLLKHFPFTIVKLRSWKEAIITQGGIDVKLIDPSTMESKLIKGLYITGEVLDIDAFTGGYNLQIAWSTGYLAGSSV